MRYPLFLEADMNQILPGHNGTTGYTSNHPPKHIIDLDRYPIDQPDHPDTRRLVNRLRGELDDVGCAVIPEFIRPDSLARMLSEAGRLMDKTHWTRESHNPYFSGDDSSLPATHPRRIFGDRYSGFIDSDILEDTSDLRAVYDWDGLTQFVSACLGVAPLYCWADPLGRNPYGIMEDGSCFPWHFDGNEFTVSILVQAAEEGGTFEYVPDLRNPGDEKFGEVGDVLKGNRQRVRTLDLRPGDLQLFKGRFSLHRVTEVTGARKRIIALPCYSKDPMYVNRPEHSKQVYGRALPIHYERQACRPDTLSD